VDFHKPEGQEIVRSLAAKSDVMFENYRAGTFDRWGIGYRQLGKINPRLIYHWLGGFGGWGPGRKRASYDILGQAQGGCFSITGQPLERVEKDSDRDFFMSPEEARTYGLLDEVIVSRDEAPKVAATARAA